MNRSMHRICSALESVPCSEGEVIFTVGTRAAQTFFVRSGELSYTLLNGALLEPAPQEGECISEATLWLEEWRHQGKLTAWAVSDLYTLEPVRFANIMRMHPKTWAFAVAYAEHFLQFVQNVEPACYIDFVRHFPNDIICSKSKSMSCC